MTTCTDHLIKKALPEHEGGELVAAVIRGLTGGTVPILLFLQWPTYSNPVVFAEPCIKVRHKQGARSNAAAVTKRHSIFRNIPATCEHGAGVEK